jgi:hypothetical protein
MPNTVDLPVLSDGAIELLRIARENDKHRAIARNVGLLHALMFTDRLVQASRANWRHDLNILFKADALPTTFVALVSLSLRTIQREVDELFARPNVKPSLPVVTDFNVHALQAQAQMLADFAWPDRTAEDFDGPPVETAVEQLKKVEVQEAWTVLVQHYVGNILQDVFAAADIRRAVPNLDDDTEELLRSEDAYQLSLYVLAITDDEARQEPGGFMFALDQAIDRVIA